MRGVLILAEVPSHVPRVLGHRPRTRPATKSAKFRGTRPPKPNPLPSASKPMSEGLVLAGRYRLTKQLGSGGMGSVWRAEDLNLGAEVAIKLIDPALADSSEALARFRREAQAAASIRSTYVVQILDHGIDQGTPYIAMELLKGESLAQRLERVGVLSPEQAARLLGHVGRALSLAHEHGIVHRDMKPENIFLVREDDEDVGKVLDFGIARQRGGLADSGGLKTSTGALLGTPYYMSPEQATGQSVDHRTDIWSFGAIACECLTGRRAFDGESLGALFHSICMAELPVPSKLAVVPPGFDAWFARAIARDRTARFQTIKEASDELRMICGRASGRSSAAFLPGSRGDTVVSGDSAAPAVTAKNGTLGFTAPPSSNTISGRRHGSYFRTLMLVLPASLIVLGGGYVGWHWLRRPSIAGTATSVAASALPSSLAQAVPTFAPPPATAQPPAVTLVDPVTSAVPSARSPAVPSKTDLRVAAVPVLPRVGNKPAPAVKPPSAPTPTPVKPAAAAEKTAKPAAPAIRDNNAAGI
jgi:eukaryotic-like serine/threonine-protein kinase